MQIDWSNIQTVMLDMDGTILDLHFDNHFWLQHMPTAYAAKHNIDKYEADQILLPMLKKFAGTLDWYCVNFWQDTLELDIMALKREVAHKIAYRPEAEFFLGQCKQKTDDLRLITNSHRQVLDLKIEHTKLDRYFSVMHCSHELEAPKEDLEFWQRLQKLQQFDPTTTLFIDDSESVLNAAHDYGIKHIYSIAKPDSQIDRAEPSRFQMIERFV
jgi:putative hydrolase of the HAD superfamily